MKTSLVLSLVFLFSITASLLSAQQKTTSIIRDASGTVKYLSQYEGQTYLLELHEDDDLSVYRYNLTQGAQHWYSINIPGLWSASNLVISDRSLLFSKSDKLVYFDFVNGDFKMNGTTATGNFKAPGKLAIPAQLSFFVGDGKNTYLVAPSSATLYTLPDSMSYHAAFDNFIFVGKNLVGGGKWYGLYDVSTDTTITLIPKANDQPGACFYNNRLWYTDTLGQVLTIGLKDKLIRNTDIQFKTKDTAKSLFTDGRTLVVVQSNVEKTFWEVFDVASAVLIWEDKFEITGGIKKGEVRWIEDHLVMRSTRDKVLIIERNKTFSMLELTIAENYLDATLPTIGHHLIVPGDNNIYIYNALQKKLNNIGLNFTTKEVKQIVGLADGDQGVFSASWINKSLPTLFAFGDEELNITEIMTFNLGCRPSARLFALDHRLVVLDNRLFEATMGNLAISSADFSKTTDKFINFSGGKAYYRSSRDGQDLLYLHDGQTELPLKNANQFPGSLLYVLESHDSYWLAFPRQLMSISKATLSWKDTVQISEFIQGQDSVIYYLINNKLSALKNDGSMLNYQAGREPFWILSGLKNQDFFVFIDDEWNLKFCSADTLVKLSEVVYPWAVFGAAGDRIFVSYSKDFSSETEWITVDTKGAVNNLQTGERKPMAFAYQNCPNFGLIYYDNDNKTAILDYTHNKLIHLSPDMTALRWIYIYISENDTLAIINREGAIESYKISMYFTEMHALNSIKLPYPTDNATITPIQNNVLFTGLNDLLIFDGKGKGTLWPLNTSFQADLKPVLWSGFYYLLAADETKERQVYKLDLEKMTYLPFEKNENSRLSESESGVCRVERRKKIYFVRADRYCRQRMENSFS